MLGGPLSVMKVWLMPANDKSTQDYFGHAITLSDTHIRLLQPRVNAVQQIWHSGMLDCIN